MPVAVVAGVDGASGLAAVRLLARAGLPVIALDHRPAASGLHSRYALSVTSPNPSDREGFTGFLRALGDAIARPAPAFPTNDEYLAVFGRASRELGGRFLLPFPELRTLERSRSRDGWTPTAGERGIPVASTTVRPEYAVSLYAAPDGEALAIFCARILARKSFVGARRPVVVPVRRAELVDWSLALVGGLGLHGFASVSFGPAADGDGPAAEYGVARVEPGLPRRHAEAASAGVGLVWTAYWNLLGARVRPARRDGVSERDGSRVAAARPRSRPGRSAGSLLIASDPGPALARAARVLRGRPR